MRVLITGGAGQLGRALQEALTAHDVTAVDIQMDNLETVDITDKSAILDVVATVRPDVLIHAAAYTNVDGCARDPELAYRVNGLGTQNVALACLEHDVEMVHISTNEVFAGCEPEGYAEWQPLRPINPYGRSKAAAETHVRAILNRAYIVRTAWLYAHDGRNFIHAILERARTTGQIQVVTDEVGNPTYVKDLAAALAALIETHQYGTYHLVNSGSTSRWAFANEILRLAQLGHATNKPILSSAYKRVSVPPPYAALRNVQAAALGITLRPWQDALAAYMQGSEA